MPPTRETPKRAYIGQDYGSSIQYTAPIEKFTKLWYNICVKALRGKSFGFAFVRLRVPHILTASQKCHCEQAFLLHGIIQPEEVGGCVGSEEGRTPSGNAAHASMENLPMERYRSGHNEAVLKICDPCGRKNIEKPCNA